MAFLVGGANTLDDSYSIENSARFDNAGGDALGGTFGTPTNAKTWTLSMWHKKSSGTTSGGQVLFGARSGYENFFLHEETIRIDWNNASGGTINFAPFIRDQSAWYHIVLAHDTSQSTDTNRAKLYINGTQITTLRSGVTATWPNQNLETGYNVNGVAFYVSSYNGSAAEINGYLADVAFIDGSQLAASSFGETDDNGVWVPKEFKDDVTFGNNGFYLEFKQTGTGTDANGIGADTSGNDNHLAVTNLTSTNICTDTPTNNFATFNPLTPFSQTNYTLSEGNCKYVTGLNQPAGVSTMAMTNGKWYWEIKKGSTVDNPAFGIVGANYGGIQGGTDYGDADSTVIQTNKTGEGGDRIGYYDDVYKNSTDLNYGSFDAIESGDIFMVALDMDNNKIWFGNNGTWLGSGDPAAGSNNVTTITSGSSQLAAVDSPAGTNVDWEINFGNPSFSISSGNADANGYGNFEYAVPSGFYALCSKNLAKYG